MSLGYTDDSIIGGPLSSTVIQQINVRKEKLNKRYSRTDNDLLYLFSNTGWVRMYSGVDIRSGYDEGNNPMYYSDFAKNFILGNGTLSYQTTPQGGSGNIVPVGGFYSYDSFGEYGTRPMAGITGFSVQSKNTFGTLRFASIDIRVNTTEQLNFIEQLYFRPGMSTLIEWGHTVYFGKDSEDFQYNFATFGKEFFTKQDVTKIPEKLENLRQKSYGNYDAMYGLVRNFSWQFSLDGGYDCKLDVVSTGDIVESVRTLISAGTSNVDKQDETKNEFQNASPLHVFCNTLKNTAQSEIKKLPDLLQTALPELFPKIKDNLKKACREFTNEGEMSKVVFAELLGLGNSNPSYDTVNTRYIPMSTFLELVNQTFMLKGDTGKPMVEFYYGQPQTVPVPTAKQESNTPPPQEETNPSGSSEPQCNPTFHTTFHTFPGHFSIDPEIALAPAKYEYPGFGYKLQDQITPSTLRSDDILDIYINVDFILRCYDKVTLQGGLKDNTVYKFVRYILDGLTKSFGYINIFDLHFVEEEFRYYIVDRRVVPSDSSINTNNSELDMLGIKSQLENLSFTTGVSSNVMSYVAISAQTKNTDVGEDLLNMQNWNDGLIDRHKGIIGISGDENKTAEERVKAEKQQVVNYVNAANEVSTETYLKYNKQETQGLYNSHKKLMAELSVYYTKVGGENPSGLIPFKLSMTIQGISGIRIGQAFKPTDYSILPQSYKDKIAFLVTELEHQVTQDNRWLTVIGAMTIISEKIDVSKLPLEEQEQLKNKPDYVPEPIELFRPPTEFTEDQAPIINPTGVGSQGYNSSPLAQKLIGLGIANGQLDKTNPKVLVHTGITGARSEYFNPKSGNAEHMLHPAAYAAFVKWRAAAGGFGITSTYRSVAHQASLQKEYSDLGTRVSRGVAAAGTSAHGWGGAVDVGDLWSKVSGDTDKDRNLEVRKDGLYKKIAEAGAKYGWYNPARLAGKGSYDECWHFEYWGTVDSPTVKDNPWDNTRKIQTQIYSLGN